MLKGLIEKLERRLTDWVERRGIPPGRLAFIAFFFWPAALFVLLLAHTAGQTRGSEVANKLKSAGATTFDPVVALNRTHQSLDLLTRDSADLRSKLSRVERLLEDAELLHRNLREEEEGHQLRIEAAIQEIRDRLEVLEKDIRSPIRLKGLWKNRRPDNPTSQPNENDDGQLL